MISIKFYIIGPCIHCLYFSFSGGALQTSAGHGVLIHGFLDHTQHTTVGRTPLDMWSACCRDLCLTTHNTHNRHPCPQQD
jgi:hypothetical protein